MKNRLDKLEKGTIQYDSPILRFDEEALIGSLYPGKKTNLEMLISSENNVPMHLYFYSKNPRVQIHEPYASGKSIKFMVQVNTNGMKEGETLEGKVDVIYNGGEIALPYRFFMDSHKEDKYPHFKTLEDFSGFYQAEKTDAIYLFERKDFVKRPFMQELRLQGLYQCFYSPKAEDYGIYEFLKAAGVLQQVMGEAHTEKKEIQQEVDPREQRTQNPLELLKYYLAYERFLNGYTKENADYPSIFRNLLVRFPENMDAHLIYVYCLINEGREKEAKTVLIRIQDRIQKERVEHKDTYCLFHYLVDVVEKNAQRTEETKKLIHRYYSDHKKSDYLFYLEYHLNPENKNNLEQGYSLLKKAFYESQGNPLVLQETCLLWNRDTKVVTNLTEFEFYGILFGLRHNLISEKILFKLLSKAFSNRKLLPLYLTVLKAGYKKFNNTTLLQAVLHVLLAERAVGEAYFKWYRRGVEAEIQLEGLFEHYLNSVPADFKQALDQRVVEYFVKAGNPGWLSLDCLYKNVLLYYQENTALMEAYRERILQFGTQKVIQEEYSMDLLPIFEFLISEGTVNSENAEGMLKLFYLKEITTKSKNAKNIVVHYPEISKDAVFSMEGDQVCCPVFSKNAILSFEDSFGNRFYDPECSSKALFDNEKCKEMCTCLTNKTLLMKLDECSEIVLSGQMREDQLILVTGTIKERKITEFYRNALYKALINLSTESSMEHLDCMPFLLEADFSGFDKESQRKLVEALIEKSYFEAAFERVLSHGFEGISGECLLKLVLFVMKQPIGKNDGTVLAICYHLYTEGSNDKEVLAYLAEYFRGKTEEMLRLLKQLKRRRIPFHDLLEETLIQSFFVKSEKDLDLLFDWYMGEKKWNEKIICSYLVLRCHEYFIAGRKMTEYGIRELKKRMTELPRIGLLAGLTYFSKQTTFSKEDKEILEEALKKALNENIVLKCFENLKNKVNLPVELEGRVFIEYRSKEAAKVSVIGSFLPEEKFFHRTLNQVYPGVFTKSFVLYRQEWMRFYYSVYEKDGKMKEVEADIVSQNDKAFLRGSRYDDIIRLEEKAESSDVKTSAEFVRSLILKERMLDSIFRSE